MIFCEFRCSQFPFLPFLSLYFTLHIREGIAFNSVVVLLWHQQLAQLNLRSSRCCEVGGDGEGGVLGRERRKKCNFTNKQGEGMFFCMPV